MQVFIKTEKDQRLREIKEIKPGCWVKLVSPTESELRKLNREHKIPMRFLRSGLDKDESQRVEEKDEAKLFIIKIPKRASVGKSTKVGTIPMAVIKTKDIVVTVCLKDNSIFKKFENNEVDGFFTVMKTRLIFQIFNATSNHYVEYMDSIEDRMNKMENKLTRSLQNKEILELLDLQKTLVYFNKAILGNNRIFESVMSGKYLQIYEDDIALLQKIMMENRESLELINIYQDLLNNTTDAYASIVSNNLNSIMKILASLTIIMAIPTIIGSLYGMNIQTPLSTYPNAFFIIVLMSFIIMGSIYLVFKKIKWL